MGPNDLDLVGVTHGLCARIVMAPDGDTTYAGYLLTNVLLQGSAEVQAWQLPTPLFPDVMIPVNVQNYSGGNFPYGWIVNPSAPQPP